jgi:hypothetical protein
MVHPNVTSIGRGGAVAAFVEDQVLLCGGRDKDGRVMKSCMGYHMRKEDWDEHSSLNDFREEATSVVVSGQVRTGGRHQNSISRQIFHK